MFAGEVTLHLHAGNRDKEETEFLFQKLEFSIGGPSSLRLTINVRNVIYRIVAPRKVGLSQNVGI